MNYLYDEFSKGFGSYYPKWVAQQEKKPAAELLKWSEEQQIPLSISIKTDTGWKEVKKVQPVGPILPRKMIVAMDLPEGDQVEIKLSTGHMFWELDYAAMDFTEETMLTVSRVLPIAAVNEKGRDVLPEISKMDRQFLVQPELGDYTIVKFKQLPLAKGKIRTVFLHSSGHYKTLRSYKGAPDPGFLKGFERTGAFTAFSRQKFGELLNKLESSRDQARNKSSAINSRKTARTEF